MCFLADVKLLQALSVCFLADVELLQALLVFSQMRVLLQAHGVVHWQSMHVCLRELAEAPAETCLKLSDFSKH